LITLSDHLHDIAENSVNAGAKNVTIVVEETSETFFFSVEDDAGGIRPDIFEKIFDPFVTTRKRRYGGWDLVCRFSSKRQKLPVDM